jgi:antitoxin component YwqK of YwqJK toxin-antitoxin module
MKLEKKVEQVGIFLYDYFIDELNRKQGVLKKYNLDKELCEELEYKDDYLNGKTLKYENGVAIFEGNYLLNKLDGEVREYYKDGKLKSISNYSNGKLHGKKENYFENEKISTITYYNEDKLDGKKQKFYESGNLELEGYYAKNNMSGIWKWYDQDGKIVKEKEY